MYCAWRIPAHLRCTQCSILLHLMDICFLTCICLWQISQIQSCRTWIGLDITRFCEQQRQPSNGSAWPACPKNGKSGPQCWGRGDSTQFAQQFEFAVTATPLVGCVVWNPGMSVCSSFLISVGMFIVSKGLLISSATVIVHGGGAIWLNPLLGVI